ncbi:SDR family NAD(P)-dependent oxidoreductase, partial [Azospirillum brasilense]|uniref:SDR family NAD(P)-dependent oxidoreductase n=1 Tax=Azospirillum brasilense TaxID=192 RepID=UPI001177C6F2
MTNRVALVTGASRGIGERIAAYFAAEGYDLVLIARDGAKLSDVAEGLRHTHGVSVRWSAVDVCAFDAARAEVEGHIAAASRASKSSSVIADVPKRKIPAELTS